MLRGALRNEVLRIYVLERVMNFEGDIENFELKILKNKYAITEKREFLEFLPKIHIARNLDERDVG